MPTLCTIIPACLAFLIYDLFFNTLEDMQVALDFIGKRGTTVGVAKPARIQYAREILQRELLPHLGIGEYCETKKVSHVFRSSLD